MLIFGDKWEFGGKKWEFWGNFANLGRKKGFLGKILGISGKVDEFWEGNGHLGEDLGFWVEKREFLWGKKNQEFFGVKTGNFRGFWRAGKRKKRELHPREKNPETAPKNSQKKS